MLKLRQLEYFRAVMQCGSINRAADYLSVSQPVVSKAISRIEEQVGLKLFERTGSSLIPTHHASVINRYCDDVFDTTHKLEGAIEDLKKAPSGSLKFCASPSLCNRLIPDTVANYRPRMNIYFESQAVKHVAASVEAGFFDFALTVWPVFADKIDCLEIAESELICICHRSHPLAGRRMIDIEDLAGHRFIFTSRRMPIGAFIERQLKGRLILKDDVIEVDRADIACSIVNAGEGVSVVNRHAFDAGRWPDVIALRLNSPMRAGIFLVKPKFKALGVESTHFIEFFLEQERTYGKNLPPSQADSFT